MNKKTKRIAGWALGLSMAVAGIGAAVGASSKSPMATKASISSKEESALTVLSSSNFDTSAEYVLKSTDGYYWNGVSGTSNNKWGGITKTLSEVERLTIAGTWADGFTIKDSSNNYLRATTGNMTWATTSPGTFKIGSDSSSNPIVYNDTSNGLKVNGTSGMRLYTNLTYNASTGKSVCLYKLPSVASLESISLSGNYPTEFENGADFSHEGMVVTATYSDATEADVTSKAVFSSPNMFAEGKQTVTVSYTENAVTKSQQYAITIAPAKTIQVNDVTLAGIEDGATLDGNNDASVYVGANIELTGTVVYQQGSEYQDGTGNINWASSNSSVATVANGVVTLLSAGTTTITATSAENNGKSASITFTIANINAKRGSADNPFSVAEAMAAAIENGSTEGSETFYATGFVRKKSGKSIWLVDDPNADMSSISDTDSLQAYRSGSQGEPTVEGGTFDDVYVHDKVTISGNLQHYNNSAPEFKNYAIVAHESEEIDLVLSKATDELVVNSEFAYSGTITADYTFMEDKTLTESDVQFTGYDTSSVGAQTVTVSWEDGEIYTDPIEAQYELTVKYADLESLTLSSYGKTVGFNDASVDLDDVTVTVNENANPGYSWSLFSAKDEGGEDMIEDVDYVYDANEHNLLTGEKAGTIVFRVTAAADPEVTADFTVTVTGDPSISLNSDVVYGFVGKPGSVSVVSVENMTAPIAYSWEVVSGGDVASATTGTASSALTFAKAGSATIRVTATDAESKMVSKTASINVINAINAIKPKTTLTKTAAWTYAQSTAQTSGETVDVDIDTNIHMLGEKATGSTPFRFWSDGIRCYAGNSVTFTPKNGAIIKSITLPTVSGTCSAENTYADNVYTIKSGGNSAITISGLSKGTIASDIKVDYEIASVGDDIANTNYASQKAALEYVASFNSTMGCEGETGNTENVATKWPTLETAFLEKRDESGEASNFNALFKYADAVEGGDALQDMLKRYDYIIEKYNGPKFNLGLKDFLHEEGGAGRDAVNAAAADSKGYGVRSLSNNASMTMAVTIITGVGLASFAGFAFLRRKKEDR